jgi:hypothetical protein
VRARTTLAAVSILAVVVGAVAGVTWWLWDANGSAPPDPSGADRTAIAAAKPALHRVPRRHVVEEPRVDVDAELEAVWDAAVATYRGGKPVEALTSLVRWRKDFPAWFAEPARAALLAEMERAALALLAKLARTGSIDDVRKLAALLKDVILDPQLLKQAADLAAAAERRAAAALLDSGADVIEHADLLADKQALTRHLQRFADRGPAPKTKDWVDTQLAGVAARNAALEKEPDPLPLPDPAEAETRRLDELDKLRQRNSIGLLDHIDGSLAWLALHQGDDGHFGGDATAARCKALKHDPACIASASEPNPLGATGLAVLAFLDFRDQDVKRLFEPTLSRGIQWIVAQQQADGSFAGQNRGYYGYESAIGLMALGNAAASTGDPALVAAVQRGINFYALHQGKDGGFRYRLDQDGDLSVTGWFVQAVESARHAGVVVPDDMTKGLDRFLNPVTLGPPPHAFGYGQGPNAYKESVSLDPVGMLSMSILRPLSPQWYGEDWRASLATSKFRGTYWLYYGVRVLLFLDGKVSDKMRGYLNDLAAKQVTKGNSAGMIPIDGSGPDWAFRNAGATSATAFATLTLEHSLYRR